MAIGRAKLIKAGKIGGRGNVKPLSTIDKPFEEPRHNTRELVAEELGWSTGKVILPKRGNCTRYGWINSNSLKAWATEINLRAKRKAGEMLAKMATEGKRSKGRRKKIEESENATLFSPTLEDIGLDKYQSSSYQKLAAIPDEQFEKDVAVASEIASETINQEP